MPVRPPARPAVPMHPGDRRLLAGVALAGLALGVVAAAAIIAGLIRFSSAPTFPGARLVAERSVYRYSLPPIAQHNTSYLTAAPFGEVYTWYSIAYELGPERYGLGNCNMMANSRTWLRIVERDTSVTVCDTPAGRMVVVSRTLVLRPR